MLKKKIDCLKLLNSIEKSQEFKKFLFPHARLLLAYSGGQDSSTLLTIFYILSKKWNFQLGVVYCNHEWIKTNKPFLTIFQKIQDYKLPFYYVDIFKNQNKKSENKAREWRYIAFKKIQKKGNYHFLLTAHTLSDKIETLLFHLCRGTGLKGINSLKTSGLFHYKKSLNKFFYENMKFSDFKIPTLINIYFQIINKNFNFFFSIYILKCYQKKIKVFEKTKSMINYTIQINNKKSIIIGFKKEFSLITFFNPTIYFLIKKLVKIFLFLIKNKLMKNKKILTNSTSGLVNKKQYKSTKLHFLIKTICIQNANKNLNYKFQCNVQHTIYINKFHLFYIIIKNNNISFVKFNKIKLHYFFQQNWTQFSYFFFSPYFYINVLKKKKKNMKIKSKNLNYIIKKNKNQTFIKHKTLINFFFFNNIIQIFFITNVLSFKFIFFNKKMKNLLQKKQKEKLITSLTLKITNTKKNEKYYQKINKLFLNHYFYLFKIQQNKFILSWKKIIQINKSAFFKKKNNSNKIINKSKIVFFFKKKQLNSFKTGKYKLVNSIIITNSNLNLNKKTFSFRKKITFSYKTKGFFILLRNFNFKKIFFNCLKTELYNQIFKNQLKFFYKKHLLIVRPLLKIDRKNLFLFAKKLNLLIYFDPTNKNLIFTRNYIRYQIIPLLKKINPKIEKNLYKFSQISYFYYKKLKNLTFISLLSDIFK